MNRVKLLFFATLRQQAGMKSVELEIPEDMDVRGLKEHIVETYPVLQDSMRSVLIAINREYAFEDAVIPAGGEVALFPPVSGG
jgi:molybdopterin converting factor subunit 1